MAWFRKEKKPLEANDKTQIPEGLWIKCDECKEIVYRKEVEQNLSVCPKCGYHFRIPARERFEILFDDGKYKEFASDIRSSDPLDFRDTKRYRDRLKVYEQRIGKDDAVVCAEGKLDGLPVVICAMEYDFMGGSMGSVVGEKITLSIERAIDKKEPMIIVSCSGGARMQEAILSLMQMAKISAALARLADAGLPYISVLTDPTTGGVTASYAMLGDINLAEPKAYIAFAGARVIEQTIRQTLPEGFQTAEFLLDKGFVDVITPRAEMKGTISRFLHAFTGK
jgi:acetyl-CoA carboxylase carboxyl transferase subunit beta